MSSTINRFEYDEAVTKEAEQRYVYLPSIAIASGLDPMIDINQVALLEGVSKIKPGHLAVTLRDFNANLAPNPSLVYDLEGQAFKLSLDERQTVSENQLNEAFWLGCLVTKAATGKNGALKYNQHQKNLKKTNSNLLAIGATALLLTPELIDQIGNTAIVAEALIMSGLILNKLKLIAEDKEVYFKKRYLGQAQTLAANYQALKFKTPDQLAANVIQFPAKVR
jgi:hypothetical protein